MVGNRYADGRFRPLGYFHVAVWFRVPKAQHIGKMIDKRNGNEREIVAPNPNSREACDTGQFAV